VSGKIDRSFAALLAVLDYLLATVRDTQLMGDNSRSYIVSFLQQLGYNVRAKVTGSASDLNGILMLRVCLARIER
jgi:ABC-type Fe3+-citrate transport system substrate-binding protein